MKIKAKITTLSAGKIVLIIFLACLPILLPIYFITSCVSSCHNHKWEITENVEATCEQDGHITRYCKKCKKEEVETIQGGHIWIENSVQNATCTENGSKTVTCERCGTVENQVIEALGHTNAIEILKEATCTEDGSSKNTCSVCGSQYTETIPAKGHSFGVYDTCVNCGEKKYRIDLVINEELPLETSYKLGDIHTYSKSIVDSVDYYIEKKSIFGTSCLYVTFNGYKSYDNDGEYGENNVTFKYIIKDGNGSIIKSDVVTIFSTIMVSQRFTITVKALDDISSFDLTRSYTLEIVDRLI